MKKFYYAHLYTDGSLITFGHKPMTKKQAKRYHKERIIGPKGEPCVVRLGIGYDSREEQEWCNA